MLTKVLCDLDYRGFHLPAGTMALVSPAVLLSRFDLWLDSPPPAPDHGSWVTGPRPPCRVRYRPRPIPLSGGL